MEVDRISNPMDVTVDPGESLSSAASKMRWNDVGCAAVMDRDILVGILTERDLTRAAADGVRPDNSPVADYMTPKPIVVSPDTPADFAARKMVSAGVRHLPILEGGRLIGVLSIRDVLADLLWTEEVDLDLLFGDGVDGSAR